MLKLIRANQPFSIFLVTQGLSNLGDAVRNVAIPLLVLQLTHAPLLVAAIALLETVPYFAFHLPMGALLDRIDRRRAMLAADLGRGALVLSIPLTAYLHGPVLALLFVVAAPLSLLSSVFDAGGGAVIPNLVARESLGQAFALFEGAELLAWVAGPLVASVLAASFGTPSALVVDGTSFLVSAAGLASIRIGRVERAATAGSVWSQIGEGLRFLAGARDLRRLQITWSLYGLIGFGAITGLVFIGSSGGTSVRRAGRLRGFDLRAWLALRHALGRSASDDPRRRTGGGRAAGVLGRRAPRRDALAGGGARRSARDRGGRGLLPGDLAHASRPGDAGGAGWRGL